LADINTWVLGSTLVVQSFGTAALMRRLSMTWVLLLGPLIYLVGFILLAMYPSLSLVVVFVVVHRTASYALIAPAVEVLYTVVPKSDLFRIKGILDTVVIRGGDVMSAQLYGGLRMLSLSLPAIAWLFVPIAGGTCLIAAWSGRQQTKQADVNSSRVM
ncbi:MAG: translocase, partial [Planctomycetota bacterium]